MFHNKEKFEKLHGATSCVRAKCYKNRMLLTVPSIPRFLLFRMASLVSKVSLAGWVFSSALLLTVTFAIGMICIDQVNRASIKECNSCLNSLSAELKADYDTSSMGTVPDGESPPEPNSLAVTSDRILRKRSVPSEKRKLPYIPTTENER